MTLTMKSEAPPVAGHHDLWMHLALSIIPGLLLGAVVATLSPGQFLPGWLAASALSTLAVFYLLSVWKWAGAGRLLGWLIALTFLLRLGFGMGLSLALPNYGYAEPEQQAGYLFKDAYVRDNQSWEIASTGRSLWDIFRNDFISDQYGGLLVLSAMVYHFLSPDAHRAFLILILGAFFAALGVAFLYRAVTLRWGARVALITGWIYAFYPDGIFFGSSQMREPFVVGLSCIAFWAVLTWNWRWPASYLALFGSLLGMAVFTSRVAVAVAGFLALLFLLEHVVGRSDRRWQVVGWVSLLVGILVVSLFTWDWFRSSSQWDVSVTDEESGRIQLMIDEASKMTGWPREDLRAPIITVYGLTRPVLPAAIVASAKSQLLKGISIARSAGWYALAPFLIYALFSVWHEPDPAKRRRVIWLALAVFAWMVIASARGGGDMTDNPRYRSLFLPWMALLAAWAVDWALTNRDAWLWRWIAVELVFMGFFTHWYVSRYYKVWAKMPLWEMIAWIAGLSALILVGGWAWDRWAGARKSLTAQVR